MKVTITGGTGFVGSSSARYFVANGHDVTVIGSSPVAESSRHLPFTVVSADTSESGSWQVHVERADLIINLAGRSIFKRWTKKYKKALRDSRILTTRHIVDAIPDDGGTVLISASAVGFYGDRGDEILTETATPGSNFLAELSKEWEQAAQAADRKGARVAIARLGIVLDAAGGAMGKMLPAFRSFLGGPLGNGNQWFSWIHREDVVRAMDFVASTPDLQGAVNFCAPDPVRNKELTRSLGAAVRRPALMPTPGWAVRTAFGEFGTTLLEGQRVVPEKLLSHGFRFQYPDLSRALDQIVRGSNPKSDF